MRFPPVFDDKESAIGTGVFVVGGLLTRRVPSFELERKWENLRKRPDIDIAYFKASACKNGGARTPRCHAELDFSLTAAGAWM